MQDHTIPNMKMSLITTCQRGPGVGFARRLTVKTAMATTETTNFLDERNSSFHGGGPPASFSTEGPSLAILSVDRVYRTTRLCPKRTRKRRINI